MVGQARDHEALGHLADGRVHHQVDRDQNQRAGDQGEADPLESAEAPCAGGANDDGTGQDHRGDLGQAEVAHGERHADELGHDGQRVQDEQIDDAEGAPELAEPLEDQPRVPHAGHGAEPQDHLLIDIDDRHEQEDRPHEVEAVVLPGLGVGAERAGIVVAHHHDEPGPDDREQRLDLARELGARRDVAVGNGAQGTADVADVLGVEDGAVVEGSRCHLTAPPITWRGVRSERLTERAATWRRGRTGLRDIGISFCLGVDASMGRSTARMAPHTQARGRKGQLGARRTPRRIPAGHGPRRSGAGCSARAEEVQLSSHAGAARYWGVRISSGSPPGSCAIRNTKYRPDRPRTSAATRVRFRCSSWSPHPRVGRCCNRRGGRPVRASPPTP